MKIRILLVLVTILITLLFNSTASATAEKDGGFGKPSITTHVEWAQQYLAFGAGINLTDDPVLQGSITLNWDNGTYLFLWGSTDMSGRPGSSLGDEYDLGLGWAGNLKGWSIDIGVTYFDEPHMGKVGHLGEEDILYVHLKAGRDIGRGWTASAAFESYITMPNTEYNGGNLYSVELAKTFKASERLSFPFSISAVYDDGGFGFDSGWFLRGNLGADITLSKTLTANIGGRYYVPFDVDDGRETDAMLYLGFTWKP